MSVSEQLETVRSALQSGGSFIYRLALDEHGRPHVCFTLGLESVLGGVDDEAASGGPLWLGRLLHPDDSAIPEQIGQFLRDRPDAPRLFEYRLTHEDGGYRWLEDWLSPVRAGQDAETELVGFVTDVTQRRSAQRHESSVRARLQMALEISGAFSYVSDLDEGTVSFHAGLENLLGYDEPLPNSLPRQWWIDRVHPDDIERCLSVVHAATAAGEGFELEYRVRHQKRDWIHIKEVARTLVDPQGRPTQHAGFVIDITEMKRLVDKLEQRDQEKDQFLAILGHELRNPLASLLSAMAVLDLVDSADKRLHKVKQIVKRQVGHMKALLDDLFLAASLLRGKVELKPQPINLRDILEGLVADHRARFDEKGIDLAFRTTTDEAVVIDGDAVRLRQIFANLLSNALKFTPSDGRVEVILTATSQTVDVTVSDTGEGIDPGVLERLFDPFRQGPQTIAREKGGLGLGLAIAKGFVELHGGTLTAHSAGSGRGSNFVVELPRESDTQTTEPATDSAARDFTDRRALLVEDNEDFAHLFQLQLEQKGLVVAWDTDGHAALERVEEFEPDIIFCDIGLPGGYSGYDVIEKLRQNDTFVTTPIIAITGYGQQTDQDSAHRVGCTEYVTKPLDPAQLDELLTKHLA
ncbi:response regulator [Persicimonas caeni]|uniref:histidine kinase n=1 Tax=Persicimonas caeni TaxID=2292766 RepID=A0A4Y6PYM6_PERCE|nr:hybrid sensor histidine kinase/response regulator [Persicimonas caeni]QDG53428.1 response regulator [Persicimonas caeni]QED34649.1 response regulator [Persicimonas caeni]